MNKVSRKDKRQKVKVFVLAAQSCLFVITGTVAPPGSSVPGILQAGILEWVAMPFSWASSKPKDRTQVSCIADRFFTV